MHSLSVSSESRRETLGKGRGSLRAARGVLVTLVCAFAVFAAGCHKTSNISYYGLAWVTVNSEPGATSNTLTQPSDFSSYIVTIDSIVLTRNDGVVVDALATPEIVDFTQLKHNTELWGTATIPDGTYTSATIQLDYTDAVINVQENGVPTKVTLIDTTGLVTPTTFQVSVTFDPAHPLVVTPTYASTSASLLALDFDLGASGKISYSGTTPTLTVNPFLTLGVLSSDNKLIRVRGALTNTNNTITTGGSTGTYSLYVRPFYDEVNNLGSLSLFSTANTIFTINGTPYTGNAGIVALSKLSAGSTMTAAYTTFVPDYNSLNQAYSGTFYPVYVVAGSTLEDNYTEGLSGDVTARNGNMLTLHASTLFINIEDLYEFQLTDTNVLLGSGTLVTADDTTMTGLNYNSIGVGQHIEARGIYEIETDGTNEIDATGTSATNTGSVRLISSDLWGSLTTAASGSLTMNVSQINGYPSSIFNFAGNGTSTATTPAIGSFVVNTGSIVLPADLVAGAPVWVNGLVAPFGSAPPDFNATAVNSESTVQVAGGTTTAAGTQACGLGSQVCQPASMRVLYNYAVGTATPFGALGTSGFTVNMANAELLTAVVRIGSEIIDLTTLPTDPTVVPTTLPLTSTFGPRYSVGNPVTSSITEAVTTSSTYLHTFSDFASFVTEYNAELTATNLVLQFTARGVYNRTTNTFTATDLNVVL